jgi:dolichol-phosphate mannosyltransferase
MLCSGWCFTFFSLSQCKLPTYVLPAAPAIALMLGHYLGYVLRQSATTAGEAFAGFWSARLATATTCLAGVGFVAYAVISGSDADAGSFNQITTYLWGLLWVSLLTCTLLLIGDRHQSKFAWCSSAAMAFLLAVMVMHQMVPEYSRRQTIFGADSPLWKESSRNLGTPIATVAHEFSEVPFYLERNDIKHFARRSDGALGELVTSHGGALIILHNRVLIGELRQQLPAGSRMQLIARRGPATLLHVTAPVAQFSALPHPLNMSR